MFVLTKGKNKFGTYLFDLFRSELNKNDVFRAVKLLLKLCDVQF